MLINGFKASIRKTTKVDIDTDVHNLPPDCGAFKEFQVSSWFCPKEWSKDGIFIPVSEGEPLWLDFRGNDSCTVIVSVQRINPITGKPANLEEGLKKDPEQNYLVLPDQLWLDGYSKEGKVYQFVVTKAGEGLAVNEYLLPKELQDSHAIGLAFYEPKVKPIPLYPNLPAIYPAGIEINWEYKPQYHPTWISNSHTGDYSSDSSFGYPKHTNVLRGIKGSSFCSPAMNCNINMNCSENSKIATQNLNNSAEDCRSVESMQKNSYDILDKAEDTLEQDLAKASMGAGGRIVQKINQDTNTVEFYKEKPSVIIPIYLALPEMFKTIMEKGERQDHTKEDKFINSAEIGNTFIPLI